MRKTQLKNVAIGLLLLAVTAIAYAPAWNGGFVWDDDDYVTKNPLLVAPDGLWRIWFSLDAPSQYFPLVYTTFRIEHSLWGLNPAGYHWVNILLHCANALLLWRLLVRLKVPGAVLAAAIFALHPVQVESVAWITERKNVLMGFFLLLTLFGWTKFLDSRPGRNRLFYALALGSYFLALTAKTTACTLPAALFLILWLRKGPITRSRLAQIVPFVVMGVGMGMVTIWWERYHIGTRGALFAMGPLERLLIASRAVWFYLGKLLWPSNLTFIYPRWNIAPSDPFAYIWLLFGIALVPVIFFARRLFGRGIEVAALFYLATLGPLLGFIMLYTFRYTFVADHYQYVACIGPIALVSAGCATLSKSFKAGVRLIWPASIVMVGLLGVLTWRQSAAYRDIETLWRSTIARNPDCWMAQSNLASLLLERGQVEEAIIHFRKAAEIWPNLAEAHNNLANALLQKGSMDEAEIELQKVLEFWPNEADAHNNLGGILLQKGKIDEAIAHFQKVLEREPNHAKAHNNLGNALLQKGEVDEAIVQYEKTLELPFDRATAHYNLGNAFSRKGQIDEAIAQYRKAVELKPTHVNAQNNLGNALQQKGESAEAIIHFRKALEADPQSVLALNNLSWILATCSDASLRDGAKAVELARQANQLSGGNSPIVLNTLAAAHAEMGQFAEAIEAAERALELADAQGNTVLKDVVEKELVLYRGGLSYHEPIK